MCETVLIPLHGCIFAGHEIYPHRHKYRRNDSALAILATSMGRRRGSKTYLCILLRIGELSWISIVKTFTKFTYNGFTSFFTSPFLTCFRFLSLYLTTHTLSLSLSFSLSLSLSLSLSFSPTKSIHSYLSSHLNFFKFNHLLIIRFLNFLY